MSSDDVSLLLRRAARICHAAAFGGQIILPVSLAEALALEWSGTSVSLAAGCESPVLSAAANIPGVAYRTGPGAAHRSSDADTSRQIPTEDGTSDNAGQTSFPTSDERTVPVLTRYSSKGASRVFQPIRAWSGSQEGARSSTEPALASTSSAELVPLRSSETAPAGSHAEVIQSALEQGAQVVKNARRLHGNPQAVVYDMRPSAHPATALAVSKGGRHDAFPPATGFGAQTGEATAHSACTDTQQQLRKLVRQSRSGTSDNRMARQSSTAKPEDVGRIRRTPLAWKPVQNVRQRDACIILLSALQLYSKRICTLVLPCSGHNLPRLRTVRGMHDRLSCMAET